MTTDASADTTRNSTDIKYKKTFPRRRVAKSLKLMLTVNISDRTATIQIVKRPMWVKSVIVGSRQVCRHG